MRSVTIYRMGKVVILNGGAVSTSKDATQSFTIDRTGVLIRPEGKDSGHPDLSVLQEEVPM